MPWIDTEVIDRSEYLIELVGPHERVCCVTNR